MPNLIRVYVEDADALLVSDMYDAGAIIRLQSCATKTGTYANEATTALVSGTKAYTLYDADGTSSTWYRTRYENAGGTVTSDWSAVFQVGGEAAGYLCSLEDVKQKLGLTGTSSDEELAEIIGQVTDEILHYTGRQLTPDPASGTKTVYLDCSMTGVVLYLPKGVRSPTYLGVASTDQPDSGSGTYTEIAAAYYYLDPPEHERSHGWPATSISLASGYYFYRGRRTVKLTASFGWAAVPPTIERIALAACVGRYMSKGSAEPRALVGPDGRMTILRDISPADMSVLDSYREPFV